MIIKLNNIKAIVHVSSEMFPLRHREKKTSFDTFLEKSCDKAKQINHHYMSE